MSYQTNENAVGKALKTFAWATIVIGFILGIVMAEVEVPRSIGDYYYTSSEFSWTIALTYWSDAFLAGLIFLGFAEIIILLQRIVDNGGRTLVLPSTADSKPEPEKFSDLPKL